MANAATAARANLPNAEQMKEKYGEITMLDFPQFTKDTFPGVTRMDLFSGLFGDVTDETMYFPAVNGRPGGFDPLSPSGQKWLEKLASILVKTGTKVQHISNNAPSNLAAYGSPEEDAKRKAGVEMAKRWLKGCAVLGVKSMRMNSPQALGPSIRPNAIARGPGDGYPRNIDVVPLLAAAIESHKEMADYGGDLGIKVTIENHWGLAADPTNIRIILDEVNHPYCEASPDFGNWEYDYMLVHGLKALAPYAIVQRAREVLGSLGRQQRRAALDAHHAGRRLQGHLRARVRAGAAQRRRRREVSLQGSADGADDADAGHGVRTRYQAGTEYVAGTSVPAQRWCPT